MSSVDFSDLQPVEELLLEEHDSLRKEIAEIDTKLHFSIDIHNLEDAIVSIPGLMYYINELISRAKKVRGMYEQLFDVYESRLYLYFRASLDKATEATIKSYISNDEKHGEMVKNLMIMDYTIGKLNAMASALNVKKEMLITYSANMRALKNSIV
jgi:hypothetical protein